MINFGPFAPPSGPWGTGLALVQCLVVATAGVNEVQNPTQYSKFANQESAKLATRTGMLLLYAPSASLALLSLVSSLSSSSSSSSTTIVSWLLALHFSKRVLESLFLHKYSGTMDLATSVMIGTYYSLVTLLILYTAAPREGTDAQQWGIGLFLVGECGNFYHHYLLRQLRSNTNENRGPKKDDKRYLPPAGGLFRFVAAPHYLFEILAFVGIALSAQSLHALLVALGMGSYLAGRAVLTQRFYQDTFDKSEWSRHKKALVPFIF